MKRIASKRNQVAIAGCAFALVLGLTACATSGATEAGTADDLAQTAGTAEAATDEATPTTMDKWGEVYPLQYASYAQNHEKENGEVHGHYQLRERVLAPVMRDGSNILLDEETGYYMVGGVKYDEDAQAWVVDPGPTSIAESSIQNYCYACKTTNWDNVFEADGWEALTKPVTEDDLAMLNGQVWECALCHGDTPGQDLGAHTAYYNYIAGDTLSELSAGDAACGQCHNGLGAKTLTTVTSQEQWDNLQPYKYGLDAESIYRAAVEIGSYAEDPDTGAKMSSSAASHWDVEFLQSSTMHEMGVSCTDCHMPQTTDGSSGTTYTSHNASGSPLENPDALAYCLTCHESQGIKDADAMVAMVKSGQQEAAKAQEACDALRQQASEALKAYREGGNVDDGKLTQLQDDFGLACSYLWTVKGAADFGVKYVHNPHASAEYIELANGLYQGIIDALA